MSYIESVQVAPEALSRANPAWVRRPTFDLGLGSAALASGLEAIVGLTVLSGVSLVLCTIAAAAFL